MNSFIEIVLSLPLNFSILPEELLTYIVYMRVKVTTCSEIYNDGVKVSVATSIPH